MTSLQLNPAPTALLPNLSAPPFQLFDMAVTADFPFQTIFPPADGPPDLTFTVVAEPPFHFDWEKVTPLFASRERTEEGQHQFLLYSANDCILLRFTDIASFYLWTDLIVCHLVNPAYEYLVEIYFLGAVLACWFELQGVLALHAAASIVDGGAVAFLSSNKGGKSSLAAALMQAGYPLLTDDILLVEVRDGRPICRSGYPQMRMWPEQAAHFFGRGQNFQKVHPRLEKRRIPVDFDDSGNFRSGRFPLNCCYIPERYGPQEEEARITMSAVSPIEGVLALAGYSFLHWLVEAMGLQPRRLKALSQIAQIAPVKGLHYPDGLAHLPAVSKALITVD